MSQPDIEVSFAGSKPSKSEKKRHSQDLQVLGRKLSALPTSRLNVIELPSRLEQALTELSRTRSHEGRRRQLQYVGKVMTLLAEDEIDYLRHAVEQFEMGLAHDSLQLHHAELWRERLIRDDHALSEWLQLYPSCDSQHVRSLIRAARQQEQSPTDTAEPHTADKKGHTARHGKAYRELFQLIKAQAPNQQHPSPTA